MSLLNRFLKILGVLIIITSCVLFLGLIVSSYNSVLVQIAGGFHIESSTLEDFITYKVFSIVRFSPIFGILIGIGILQWRDSIALIFNKIIHLLNSIYRFYNCQLKKDKVLFFILLFIFMVMSTFYIFTMPISYDEAWTYLNFTQHNALVSLTYYPAPNNHVLHSMLTNVCSFLPFNEIVNLRLPNFIVSILSIWFLYFSFSKLLNTKISLFITGLYISLFPILYYSFCSRGYAIVLLAFIISFHGAIQLINNKESIRKYYFYTSAGGVVGIFTMPSFIYAYFSIMLFTGLILLIQKREGVIKRHFSYGLIVLFISSLLYLPLILISGIQSLVGNKYVESIARKDVIFNLWSHFNETSIFTYGLSLPIFILILSSIVISLLIRSKTKVITVFCLALILIAPILLIIHSVIPFPRTWIYLIIPFLYLLGLFLFEFRIKSIYIIASLVVVMMVNYYHFFTKINEYESFSLNIHEISKYLIQDGTNKIYCNHPLADANLLFEIRTNNKQTQLTYSRKNIRMDNTLDYDYLITDVEFICENFRLIDQYEGIFVYKKQIAQ